MSVIATEGKKVSDLLVNELWADLGYCRTTYTYNGAAKTFAIGELVTAVGGVPAAAANITGIVLQSVTAPLNTNTTLTVLEKGPAVVKGGGIVLGALTLPNVTAQLKTMGIAVLETI